MVMETIDKVISNLGAADIDARLEELLVDGILYAFQEQVRGCEGPGGHSKARLWRLTQAVMEGPAISCRALHCVCSMWELMQPVTANTHAASSCFMTFMTYLVS